MHRTSQSVADELDEILLGQGIGERTETGGRSHGAMVRRQSVSGEDAAGPVHPIK
jgi:hypothetical protein